jgi:hypothetical protein
MPQVCGAKPTLTFVLITFAYRLPILSSLCTSPTPTPGSSSAHTCMIPGQRSTRSSPYDIRVYFYVISTPHTSNLLAGEYGPSPVWDQRQKAYFASPRAIWRYPRRLFCIITPTKISNSFYPVLTIAPHASPAADLRRLGFSLGGCCTDVNPSAYLQLLARTLTPGPWSRQVYLDEPQYGPTSAPATPLASTTAAPTVGELQDLELTRLIDETPLLEVHFREHPSPSTPTTTQEDISVFTPVLLLASVFRTVKICFALLLPPPPSA